MASLPDPDDEYKPCIFHTLANRLGKAGRARITSIDNQGNLLGDSELSSLELKITENHLNKEEIRQAIKTGSGSSRRYSSVLQQDMFYSAASHAWKYEQTDQTNDQPHHFFIARAALPESSISKVIVNMRIGLSLVSASGLLCIGFLNVLSSKLVANMVKKRKINTRRKSNASNPRDFPFTKP